MDIVPSKLNVKRRLSKLGKKERRLAWLGLILAISGAGLIGVGIWKSLGAWPIAVGVVVLVMGLVFVNRVLPQYEIDMKEGERFILRSKSPNDPE